MPFSLDKLVLALFPASINDERMPTKQAQRLLEQAEKEGVDIQADTGRGPLLNLVCERLHRHQPETAVFLVKKGSNPFHGALTNAVDREEYVLALDMVKIGIEKGMTPASGSLFELLLSLPLRPRTPALIRCCLDLGLDLNPPPGTTWFHVLANHPEGFAPAHLGGPYSQEDSGVAWELVDELLEQGFDPAEKNSNGQSGLEALQERVAAGAYPHPNLEAWNLLIQKTHHQALQSRVPRGAPPSKKPRI